MILSKSKDTLLPRPRRGGNRILRKASRKIREYFNEDDYQYMGGEDESDGILYIAELFICLYQIIGQCYYVYCAFRFKGLSPFAAQILTGAISFAMDEFVDHQQKLGK